MPITTIHRRRRGPFKKARDDGRCSIADLELAEDVVDVCLDGGARDEETPCNLGIVQPSCHQAEDLELLAGKAGGTIADLPASRDSCDQPLLDKRVQLNLTLMHRFD